MLPYGVVALAYGPLTRYFQPRRIIVVTLALFGIFNLLSGLAGNYTQLFICRFLVGVFAASVTPLVLIYLADHAGPTSRGRYVGLYFSSTFVSGLLGLFLSGWVPWRVMFFVPAALAFAVVFLTARFFPDIAAPVLATGSRSSRYLEALQQPEIARVFCYIFIVSFLYHGIRQWLGVYFADIFSMRQLLISVLLLLVSFAGVFGEAMGGSFADKKGRLPTLKLGAFLMSLSLFMLVFARSVAVLPFLMLLWGFGWTVNHAALSTFLTDLNKNFMKEISSLNSSVRFVAGAFGVMAGGFVLQKSFVFGFLLYAVILFGLFFFARQILVTQKIRDDLAEFKR